MYVNPIPFGIFIGVTSTIVIEILLFIIFVISSGGKNK